MTEASAGASAPLPFKTAAAAELPSASEWLLAVLLCAALLAALVWVLRRQHGKPQWGRQAGLMKILDRQTLTTQVQLVVLQYGQRQLLISVGPAGTQCLRDDRRDDLPGGPTANEADGTATAPASEEPRS